MTRIAFIGTRNLNEIPPEALDLFDLAASLCLRRGYTLVTGACKGADQRAAEICLEAGGAVDLILPWKGYEKAWTERMMGQYFHRVLRTDLISDAGYESVKQFHPNSTVLTQCTIKLHARNYDIVSECKSVIAIPRPPEQGGTAQGIRIARALGIPVFNLSLAEDREKFLKLVERAA